MQKTSARLNNIAESATLAMARMSRELKEKGVQVISLSLGEPDFNTPDFIKDAAKKAIDENYTRYMAVNGYVDLRESIAHKFKRDNGLTYTAEQIVVSTGAKQSIMNVVMALINPGDEVIIPAPYWVSYAEMVRLAEGVPVIVNAGVEKDFKASAADIEPYINEKTKLLMFSSPCNPSGSVYTHEEIREIAGVLAKNKHVIAISDEIYEHINFTGNHCSLASFGEVYDQVVTVNGISKAFAMTGWRLGYIGAPLWIAQACTKLQGQFTSGANGITQRAAKAAIDADPSVTHEMRNTFLKRRDLMLAKLREIPGLVCNVPQGAFYLFPDVSSYFGKSANGKTINNAYEMSLYLLEDAHVAVVSGEAFGNPECIRLSYAASDEELTEAANRLKIALANLA
jgi:aspartate aminotransferase